jgi:hypothetical protein
VAAVVSAGQPASQLNASNFLHFFNNHNHAYQDH